MNNTRRYETDNSQNELSAAVLKLSDILNTYKTLDHLYESIYTTLNDLILLPEFFIAIRQPGKQKTTLPFKIGKQINDAAHLLVEHALKTDRVLTLHQNQAKKIIPSKMQTKQVLPSVFVSIPITCGQQIRGIIGVQHDTNPDYFTPEILMLLQTAANQINVALDKNRYADELDTLQNYLYNIINSMPSILIVLDKNTIVTQWNFQAELETGVKEKDAIGKPVEQVFPRIFKYMDLIKESVAFNRLKTRLRQHYSDKEDTRFEDVIIYPLITEKQEGVVIRMDDITDQVRLEEMMIQSEKMLSIGGLAAGMAHEINNPIAGMMQNAQVIYNRLSNDIPANETAASQAGICLEDIRTYAQKRQIFEKLDQINETGTRAAEIIRNMLGFARKSDTVFKDHDLPKMLKKTLSLIQNDYNLKEAYDFKLIDIIEEFDLDIPPVSCDKSKLQQVFFNLLKNGAEAMFETKDPSFQPRFVFRIYKKDNMACIEIENNGPPISEEDQKRLFEPFFTTKQVGHGTGLGLSLSYFIIVKDHNGEMIVESSRQTNTRFTIKLPY